MNELSQFWWNWGVQFAVAVGTLLVAVAAIFGDWIKSQLFHPRLSLALVNRLGELTTVGLEFEGSVREEKCRIYHLRVTNARLWPQATQVQIMLVRLEEPGPDGKPQIRWTGDVPMQWKFPQIHPLHATVGRPAICDLFTVVKDKWLELHPIMIPNNLNAKRREPTHILASLQAWSNEGVSPILRLRIDWDGAWEEGSQEMARHLKVMEEVS